MQFLLRELFKDGRTRKIKTIQTKKQVSNPDKKLYYKNQFYYKNIYSNTSLTKF